MKPKDILCILFWPDCCVCVCVCVFACARCGSSRSRAALVLLLWGDDDLFSVVDQKAPSLTGNRVHEDRLHHGPTPRLLYCPVHHIHLTGKHTQISLLYHLTQHRSDNVSDVFIPVLPPTMWALACACPAWRRGRRGSSENVAFCKVLKSPHRRWDPKWAGPRGTMGSPPAEFSFKYTWSSLCCIERCVLHLLMLSLNFTEIPNLQVFGTF